MKERPILYSAPMVREVLEDRKTQTRRVVKSFKHLVPALGEERDCIKDVDGLPSRLDIAPRNWDCCPYGVPGDRLWVRETWYCDHYKVQRGPYEEVEQARELLYYRATDAVEDGSPDCWTGFSGETMRPPWKPAIHMPRWASRILLEITSVRAERVQDISEADAIAEGIPDPAAVEEAPAHDDARGAFRDLWDSINATRGFGWDANPWVWAIEFRRVEQ